MGLLLVMAFCFLCFAAGNGAAATASSSNSSPNKSKGMKMPGFLYTRAAGRCTPQYWSSGREAWPNMIPQQSSVAKIFGSRVLERYEPGLTMWEAMQGNDDISGSVYSKLVKHSSVALLNAYTRPGFPFRSWEVKTLLLEALVSKDSAVAQAKSFELANQACD